MITAKEAKQISSDSIDKATKSMLNIIDREIRKACKEGKTSINIYDNMSVLVKSKLASNGFHIKESNSQRDGYCATISWGAIWHTHN